MACYILVEFMVTKHNKKKTRKPYSFEESDFVPSNPMPWIHAGAKGWTCKCGSFQALDNTVPWEWFKEHMKCGELG
jgi:hypothetical protein